ncbi:MAG: phosphonoacetaldehyde hydrolase [Myxococcota bacterium]
MSSSVLFRNRREYVGGIRAVIFDWAGTTMDFGCMAPPDAFCEVFRRHGVAVTIEEARIPMGAHKRVHISRIGALPRVAAAWRAAHGRDFGEADVDRLFEDFVPIQLDILPRYADLVPGALEAVAACRAKGLKIGSTTGYTLAMNTLLRAEAERRGYVPDAMVCADEVPEGRPAPWMCLENAKRLGVYPMAALIKVGDTLPDMLEGLDAGMWAIGLAVTGNEVGLSQADWEALPSAEKDLRRQRAYERLYGVGAHAVVDGIWDVIPAIEAIERRMARGERP